MAREINKRRKLTKYVTLSVIVVLLIIYTILYMHDKNLLFNILETYKKEVENFFMDNSKEMKWIEISMFDFTQDGKSEIIISEIYVERGMMSPVSKNMVFNSSGDQIIEYIGGYSDEIELCKTLKGEEIFLIQDNIHFGAGNDIEMYIEIYMVDNIWMHEIKYVNWCVQSKEIIYENITREEESGIWAGYEGFLKCFKSREATSYENLEKYLNSLEYIKKIKLNDVGALYGGDIYLWRGDNLYVNDSFKRKIEKVFN